MEFVFVFANVYASNKGSERQETLQKLKELLQQCGQRECIVIGGTGTAQ